MRRDCKSTGRAKVSEARLNIYELLTTSSALVGASARPTRGAAQPFEVVNQAYLT